LRDNDPLKIIMDNLILAATSFIIAVSLMMTGKKDKLQASFAGLCAAVFTSQVATTLGNIFSFGFLTIIRYLGLLTIAPLAFLFFRYLTRERTLLSQRTFFVLVLISACGAFFVFTPLAQTTYFYPVIVCYIMFVLVLCYIALLWHVTKSPAGTEKRRLGYLLAACPVALMVSHIHLLNAWGLNLPVISGMVISLLLYFTLLIIAYPQLQKLHDFFARSLVILVSTVTGAVILYFAVGYFNGTPPFSGLLVASFLIVISLSPMRMILRKIFNYFYPESRDVFTSLYEFDEKLEREKDLMLAEMAPVLAHEIRNPLGSIKGAAQYLKEEAANEEQRNLLNVIVEGTDRLNNVVSRFLEYTRPDRLNLKRQNINGIIQKAIALIAADQRLEKINIVRELDENLPAVEVDDQQLMQVILNMALNAIESMPQGGTLTFRTSGPGADAESMVTLSIRDTGPGIGKSDIKNIFKPFFTTKERGAGLGLAICQKIIKEHGGSISVESTPSSGTEFLIRIKTVE